MSSSVKTPGPARGRLAPARTGDRAGPGTMQARIQEHYAVLPGSERKVADLILDFPGEVAAYSATELAELAGASKAAVTRLIRRLNYSSFEEARRASRDARKWGSPVYLLSKDADRPAFATRVRRHIDEDVKNISRTFEGVDEEAFRQMVSAIARARRVWLHGYRNSHFLAAYARALFMQVRGDVHLLPAPAETLAECMADFDPADILIFIGFRRRMPEMNRTLEIARSLGVPVLFITDPTARPAIPATWTVRCEVRCRDLFDRYSAAMSFLHFLSVAVVSKAGARGRGRLKRIEDLHEELHDFG